MQRNRRAFLAAAGAALAAPLAGCLGDLESNRLGPETDADDPHSCRETWRVVLYNESDEAASLEVTIRDREDGVVFSDTVEVDPDTDRFTGTELDAEIRYDRSYTFEAELAAGRAISEETVVNCGNVYIFVTESGELEIRDDEVDQPP